VLEETKTRPGGREPLTLTPEARLIIVNNRDDVSEIASQDDGMRVIDDGNAEVAAGPTEETTERLLLLLIGSS